MVSVDAQRKAAEYGGYVRLDREMSIIEIGAVAPQVRLK